jgi:hypothetical protein
VGREGRANVRRLRTVHLEQSIVEPELRKPNDPRINFLQE